MTTITTDLSPEIDVDGFAEKVFGDVLGAMNVYAVTLGVRLGWYEALAAVPSISSVELAVATDTDERYAREWLEQQAVAGYVAVAEHNDDGSARRFVLSPAGAEVLSDPDSLAFMAPFATFVSTLGRSMDALVDVYRSGGGLGWHEHGDGARCGQAAANRPMFLHQLGQEYLASIPDVAAKLAAGASVADVGCGMGWSSIGLATAFPTVTVDGFDIDEPSIAHANDNAAEAGVADRVSFRTADVAQLGGAGYDLVLALECVHDLPDPVSFLASMRSLAASDGAVIVMDERVGEIFTGEPDPVEQMFYGFSLICCLPDGRSAQGSAATGTVMRRPTLEGYARSAGFSSVEVLPIENDFFRFYRLER